MDILLTISTQIGFFILGAVLIKRKYSFAATLGYNVIMYLASWLLFAIIWACAFLCTFILNLFDVSANWDNSILDIKYVIQVISYICLVIFFYIGSTDSETPDSMKDETTNESTSCETPSASTDSSVRETLDKTHREPKIIEKEYHNKSMFSKAAAKQLEL